MAGVLEETVVTTEVEEACALGSAITGITVNTVDCVVDCTTGAAGGCETDVAVGAADGVDEEASVTTVETAARLGGAIALEIAVGAELVTSVNVGVIVTLNAGLREQTRDRLRSPRTTRVRRGVGCCQRSKLESSASRKRRTEHGGSRAWSRGVQRGDRDGYSEGLRA